MLSEYTSTLVILAVTWTSTCTIRSGNGNRQLVSAVEDMELRSEQRILDSLCCQSNGLRTSSANTLCPFVSPQIILTVSWPTRPRFPQHRNRRAADPSEPYTSSKIAQIHLQPEARPPTAFEITSRITRGRNTISDAGCRPSSTSKKGFSAK